MDPWSICVPGVPSMVPVVRLFTRAYLAGHPLAADAALITSQYMANAIRHTEAGDVAAVSVTVVTVGDLVRIEVTRVAPVVQTPEPSVAPPSPADESSAEDGHGRGLVIVDAIAHRWGHRGTAGRDTAWAELRHVLA